MDYEDRPEEALFVDVRTAAEYDRGHIPGAVNLPLFDEEERHAIGLHYKQSSREEAKRLGVVTMAKKLPDYYDRVVTLLDLRRPLLFYCARGGMRSGSIGALLQSLGHPVFLLAGGFKAYRRKVLEAFDDPAFFDRAYVMLHGHTGVGKTEILQALSARGAQVLDLEGLADHRGSLLGGIGKEPLKSQMQYENEIFARFEHFSEGPVFLESESRRVGEVVVPKPLFEAMNQKHHVLVEDSLQGRVERLVADYGAAADFHEKIGPILERLGQYHERAVQKQLLGYYTAGDLPGLARHLMVAHYDPLYKKSERTYQYDLVARHDDTGALAERLLARFCP